MNWDDLLSLLVTVLLLFFFFFRRQPDKRELEEKEENVEQQRSQDGMETQWEEEEEEELAEEVRATMHSAAQSMPHLPEEFEPSRSRFVIHPKTYKREDVKRPKSTEHHPRNVYKQAKHRKSSRGALLIRKPHSLKNAIVLKEIFGKPRSDKPWE